MALQKTINRINSFCDKHPRLTLMIAGAVSALALPFWNIIPLFFLGFSTFLYTSSNVTSLKTAFLNGFLYFFAYFSVGLYWIGNAMLVHIDEFWWAYPFALFGLPLYLSLYFGAAAAIAIKHSPANHINRIIGLILFITLADIIRGYAFTGFPWNSPGLIWASSLVMSQIAALGGLMLLSAMTFFWAGLPLTITRAITLHCRASLIISAVIIASMITSYTYGHIRIAAYDAAKSMAAQTAATDNNLHKIIVVQPNIPQIEKWDADKIPANFKKHLDITLQALGQNTPKARSTTIIWPETAVPYYLMQNPTIRDTLSRLPDYNASTGPTYLLTGVLDKIEFPKGRAEQDTQAEYTNSLIALDTERSILRYNKHHLVPFGEYMPYQDILGWMPLVQVGGFKKGDAPAALSLPNGPTFLPLICYEIIFPKYSYAAQKADFIVNITNDAWYGNSAGPYQHLALSKFRAIEQGRPVIRAANTGISAIISPIGKTEEILPYGENGFIEHNHKVEQKVITLHQHHHYLLLTIYFSIIIGVFLVLRRKTQ